MTNPSPSWGVVNLDGHVVGTRPTLTSLLQSGDEIALQLQTSPSRPAEFHRVTVTAMEDDEPNRRILMTVHVPSVGSTVTNPVKPGDLVHRLTATDESREPVYVAAPELWKWEGLRITDPNGNGRVQLIRAQRGPHPEDGREILALVVEDEQGQRRPIYVEMTGGLFCDWTA
jgi:hypothetical protein